MFAVLHLIAGGIVSSLNVLGWSDLCSQPPQYLLAVTCFSGCGV